MVFIKMDLISIRNMQIFSPSALTLWGPQGTGFPNGEGVKVVKAVKVSCDTGIYEINAFFRKEALLS